MAKRKNSKKIKEDETLCLLIKSKEIVEKRWILGAYESDGKVCAIGAIGEAFNGNPRHLVNPHDDAAMQAAEELSSVIRIRDFDDDDSLDATSRIPHWNDQCSRRKHHVVKAFDRAIKKRIRKIEQGKV